MCIRDSYNRDGYSYILGSQETAVDIERDSSDDTLKLLSYREAGTVTTFITEMVTQTVGKGRKRRTITVPEIREQIDYVEAGLY